MAAQFVTEGAGKWDAGITGPGRDNFIDVALTKGRGWLRQVVVSPTAVRSDDLAFLVYECWRGMSELKHDGELDDDFTVAGDVLDEWVTDHDAELLVEAIPDVAALMEGPVGGMTPEVSGVHMLLLHACGAMREKWSDD